MFGKKAEVKYDEATKRKLNAAFGEAENTLDNIKEDMPRLNDLAIKTEKMGRTYGKQGSFIKQMIENVELHPELSSFLEDVSNRALKISDELLDISSRLHGMWNELYHFIEVMEDKREKALDKYIKAIES